MKIILTIKQIFKILFSKQFWKYVIDGLLYQLPKRLANKIENTTNELNDISNRLKKLKGSK